jgi:hypothetical protein
VGDLLNGLLSGGIAKRDGSLETRDWLDDFLKAVNTFDPLVVLLITARDTSESLSSHLPRTPEASLALEARQIPDLISIISKLDDVVLPLLTSVQPAIGLHNRALETRRISDRSGIFGDLLSGSGNGGSLLSMTLQVDSRSKRSQEA